MKTKQNQKRPIKPEVKVTLLFSVGLKSVGLKRVFEGVCEVSARYNVIRGQLWRLGRWDRGVTAETRMQKIYAIGYHSNDFFPQSHI